MSKRIWYVPVISFCCLCLSLSAQPSPGEKPLVSRLEKGYHLFHNGDYAGALSVFSRQRELPFEERESVEYHKALCSMYLDDDSAADAMEEFLDTYPATIHRQKAYLLTGDFLYRRRQYPQALEWYEKVDKFALKNRSQREGYLFRTAYCHFLSGNYPDAKAGFSQCLESRDHAVESAYYYAHICYNEGDDESALRYFEKCKDDPRFSGQVPYYMVNILYRQKKFDQAIALGNRLLENTSLKHDPNTPVIRKVVGECLFEQGKYSEALPYLLEYQQSGASLSDADLYRLGYAYYKSADYPRAISYFNRIIAGKDALAQNAYYVLADCYLNTDRKNEALNAFKAASEMDFDGRIAEDGLYNYAKLSYELGNPYVSVSKVLKSYLDRYPSSIRCEEIKKYLLDSYVSSKNYAEAIEEISTIENPSYTERVYLQKAAFYSASQALNASDMQKACKMYELSLLNGFDPYYRAKSLFWLGETYIRLGKYPQAASALSEYRNSTAAPRTEEYPKLDYQFGYLSARQGKYREALDYFRRYGAAGRLSGTALSENTLRIADCQFAVKDFAGAAASYRKVAEAGFNADYALYQQAVCYSLLGQTPEQIKTLSTLLSSYPSSSYRASARFDMGTAYQRQGDKSKALDSFLKVEKENPGSEIIPRANSRAALIYYENNQLDKALDLYQKTVRNYPKSSETPTALRNARSIYVEQGRADEFIAWSRQTGLPSLDQISVDSLKYESGERAFLREDYPGSLASFDKYLAEFPEGMFAANANYYAAQALIRTDRPIQALDYLDRVASMPKNSFTEPALVNSAEITIQADSTDRALAYLERLYGEAENPQNKKFAAVNLMTLYDGQEDYENAIRYAVLIAENYKEDPALYADAVVGNFVNCVRSSRMESAKTLLPEALKVAKGENMAKVLLARAEIEYGDKNYQESIRTVASLAADYPAYKYWGAKGLVLMARSYHALGDLYQATYILQSVIDNFDYQDIREEARAILDYINRTAQQTPAGNKNQTL